MRYLNANIFVDDHFVHGSFTVENGRFTAQISAASEIDPRTIRYFDRNNEFIRHAITTGFFAKFAEESGVTNFLSVCRSKFLNLLGGVTVKNSLTLCAPILRRLILRIVEPEFIRRYPQFRSSWPRFPRWWDQTTGSRYDRPPRK